MQTPRRKRVDLSYYRQTDRQMRPKKLPRRFADGNYHGIFFWHFASYDTCAIVWYSGCGADGQSVLQQSQQDTEGDVRLHFAQSHDQDTASVPRRPCFRQRWRHEVSPVWWRQRRSAVHVLPGRLCRRLHQRGPCIYQGSWKVLDFWRKFPGPGESWKMRLVLD